MLKYLYERCAGMVVVPGQSWVKQAKCQLHGHKSRIIIGSVKPFWFILNSRNLLQWNACYEPLWWDKKSWPDLGVGLIQISFHM